MQDLDQIEAFFAKLVNQGRRLRVRE